MGRVPKFILRSHQFSHGQKSQALYQLESLLTVSWTRLAYQAAGCLYRDAQRMAYSETEWGRIGIPWYNQRFKQQAIVNGSVIGRKAGISSHWPRGQEANRLGWFFLFFFFFWGGGGGGGGGGGDRERKGGGGWLVRTHKPWRRRPVFCLWLGWWCRSRAAPRWTGLLGLRTSPGPSTPAQQHRRQNGHQRQRVKTDLDWTLRRIFSAIHRTVVQYAVLYCTVLYCTVLYCTVLYCTVLYCTVLYCTVLYCTVLYCTVLYCTAMKCYVLCHAALYCRCVMLCRVLCCTVPCCFVVCRALLCHVPCSAALRSAVWFCAVLCSPVSRYALCCAALRYVVMCCVVLFRAVLRCAVLLRASAVPCGPVSCCVVSVICCIW